ncbi:Zinc finger protein [Vanrija pseudolonga]|uniref:Zinc finger protein n=1 Tax=Vanrija pseudolonga TaxID=143232 RepID=A0AAF0YE76_9TREE|nr:Zinc finger protein [Vanrija pseudolonga]
MDAKSLLRARKATARVEHPHASYTAAGQLRCAICAVPVNQWDAHLLTKQHRQSAAREKAQAEKAAKAKRRSEAEREEGAKRAKVEQEGDSDDDDAGPSLPAGFFSAGNKPSVGEEEDAAGPTPPPAPAAPKPTGDAELDDFLASLNDDDDDAPAPAQPAAPAAAAAPARRKGLAYKKTEEAPGVASYAAAPVLLANGAANEDAAEPEPEEPEESEAEKRARLEREEREEIVARLEDEQRAQEDADSRVVALKARMEALKKRRAAGAGKKA